MAGVKLSGVLESPFPQRQRGGKFVRASLPWLDAAAELPGKAPLVIGLRLWFASGCKRDRTVPLNLSHLGISRRRAGPALRALENAGLVRIEYRNGRPPLVTLIVEE